MQAADDMLRTIDRFQRSDSRTLLPPNNLAVDFVQRSPLGARALKLTARKQSRTIGIMCEPEDVVNRLQGIGDTTADRLQDIGLVLVNYVLHDVPEERRSDFLADIADACPHAMIMIADYTMRDMTQAEAAVLFTADLERNRIAEKSWHIYLEEHLQFTYHSLYALLQGTMGSVRGHRLPAGRALVAGSRSAALWTPDMDADWTEESLDISKAPMPLRLRQKHLEGVGITT